MHYCHNHYDGGERRRREALSPPIENNNSTNHTATPGEDVFMVVELSIPIDSERDRDDFERVLKDHIIAAPSRERRQLGPFVNDKAAGRTYTPVPPPCLPPAITSLCEHACDRPGITALVIVGLAVMIGVEIIALIFCGGMLKSLVTRCKNGKSLYHSNAESAVTAGDRCTNVIGGGI